VLGVSIDSIYCHKNWGNSLGGVTFPLLADFHPKGAMAQEYGAYLAEKGITDRATVIVDKNGVVRYAVSVTPAGQRNPKDLLAECQKIKG
jgi:alkyl hydroperoxide reductase subunit AhpC